MSGGLFYVSAGFFKGRGPVSRETTGRSQDPFQVGEAVVVSDLVQRGSREFPGQEVKKVGQVFHAVQVVRRMADAVEIAAEADVVVGPHDIHHVGEVPVDAFDAGIVVILFQELAGEVDADEALRLREGAQLVVPQVAWMAGQAVGAGMGGDDRF